MKYSDKALLDWLQEQNNKAKYTGRCVFRWSGTGRGWRLHETSEIGYADIRLAITEAINNEENKQ